MKKILFLLSLITTACAGSVFDWFRSSISNTENYIQELTKEIENTAIYYDSALDSLDKNDNKNLKQEIEKGRRTLAYCLYIQAIDRRVSNIFQCNSQIKNFLQKSDPKSDQDKARYKDCLSLYNNLKTEMQNIVQKLKSLRKHIAKKFSKYLVAELIELKEMYDRIPSRCYCNCGCTGCDSLFGIPTYNTTYNYPQSTSSTTQSTTQIVSTRPDEKQAEPVVQRQEGHAIITGPEDIVANIYNQ